MIIIIITIYFSFFFLNNYIYIFMPDYVILFCIMHVRIQDYMHAI